MFCQCKHAFHWFWIACLLGPRNQALLPAFIKQHLYGLIDEAEFLLLQKKSANILLSFFLSHRLDTCIRVSCTMYICQAA